MNRFVTCATVVQIAGLGKVWQLVSVVAHHIFL